ncbi:MAG: site-specific integrase [Bacteroides sp.]|nr:site-specific integrase [Eubacterium sp.]MCM1418168.1 site-specific integrase [Roseburia sp.]MCM1462307.1 site-specific integrase [Bacteroides sp.]
MATRKTYRKIITSDETYEHVDASTRELVEDFLRDYNIRSSPRSVEIYRSNYRIFLCWNYQYNNNIPFVQINKRQLKRFFIFASEELKWGSSRYKNMWSSLNTFSEWIENVCDDIYPNFRNNVKKIEKVPKSVAREKSVFTKQELDGLMEKLAAKGKVQECCLLALIMSSGMRISEVARMRTEYIDRNNTAFDGLFLETTKQIQTKGRGQDGKPLHKYLIKDLFLPAYEKWMAEREKTLVQCEKEDHGYIFITAKGDPAQVSTFRYWMSRWDSLLDGGKHWYAHAGRHFWTSYLSAIGLEKQLIQELQGWSSDTLVDLYDDNTAKDMAWKGLEKLKNELQKGDDANAGD